MASSEFPSAATVCCSISTSAGCLFSRETFARFLVDNFVGNCVDPLDSILFCSNSGHSLNISSKHSTSFAPSLISLWQPLLCGLSIEPGIAITSRPISPASRAVMSEPLSNAASTTKTACAKPAINRFLRGKLPAKGRVPNGNSDTITPCSAIW